MTLPSWLQPIVEETMGGPAEDSCRHCGKPLWKVRDQSSHQRGYQWVSYIGMDRDGTTVTTRFCDRDLFPNDSRRQHAPIPTKPKKLDAWLES